MREQVEVTREYVEEKELAYKKNLKGEHAAFFAKHAPKKPFIAAYFALEQASGTLDKLEANHYLTAKENELRGKWQEALDDARQEADRPDELLAHLLSARNETRAWLKALRHNYEVITSGIARGWPVYQKAVAEYPATATATTALYTPLKELAAQGAETFVQAKNALGKNAGEPDYLAFIECCNRMYRLAVAMKEKLPNWEKQAASLYRSYVLVYKGRETRYLVRLTRLSWDYEKGREAGHSHQYVTRSIKDEKCLKFFRGLTYDQKAIQYSYQPGKGITLDDEYAEHGLSTTGIDLAGLKLDATEGWPEGDNLAELRVGSIETEYYARFVEIINSKKGEPFWRKVSKEEYDDLSGKKGKAILTKPYGVAEVNARREIDLPGVGLVNNPRYGKWLKLGDDKQIWRWSREYDFFAGMAAACLSSKLQERLGRKVYFTESEYMRWLSGRSSMTSLMYKRYKETSGATNFFEADGIKPLPEPLTFDSQNNG